MVKIDSHLKVDIPLNKTYFSEYILINRIDFFDERTKASLAPNMIVIKISAM